MASSASHKAASRRYSDKHYERVPVDVRKGDREKLKAAAAAAGMSLNRFVLRGGAVDVLDWLKEGSEGESEQS